MISVDEAQEKILSQIPRMPAESLFLSASLGRTLASDMVSSVDHPPWNASAMDGYAVVGADTDGASQNSPVKLTVVEEVRAGQMPNKKVGRGEAAKVMTGAPIPEGADAVVKIEEVKRSGREVTLFDQVQVGAFIRKKGEAVSAGELILKQGLFIRPFEISMIASMGIVQISVYQQPRVAILATGDELADLHETRKPDQIYNSNSYGLAAQVVDAGGIPMMLGIAKDKKTDLMEKIARGQCADFMVISGGVSVGDYDFVKEVMEEIGAKMAFWKVAMKPGRPLAFGTLSGKPLFGLPGNPVSSLVTFEQFVRPALLFASGRDRLYRPVISAILEDTVEKHRGLRAFLRGIVSTRDGKFFVRTTGDQDSGILLSLVKASALIILPEEAERVVAGTEVSIQLLSDMGAA